MALSDEDRKEIKLLIITELTSANIEVNTYLEKNEADPGVRKDAGIIFGMIHNALTRRHQIIYEGEE